MDATKAALLTALNSQRDHVLGILEGASDEALRRAVLPSGWTCLGLVRHLTISDEQFWFRGIMSGETDLLTLTEESYQAAWRVDAATTADAVFDAYRAAVSRSNEIIEATGLEAPPAFWPVETWPEWRLPDLRAVLLHVITETATHAGHLDAVRELIDGRTWLT
jgi:hypothetical protein